MLELKKLKLQSRTELQARLNELQRMQFKLRLVKASGEMKQTHGIRQTRRNIARILTILTETDKVSS